MRLDFAPTRRHVVAGALAVAAAGRGSPAGAVAHPRFEVVGSALHWGGAPIRLTGVAVGDPIYIRKDRAVSDYATIAGDWDANVVRISIHPGHWRAAPARTMKRLGAEVEAARHAGLFVIVDWHVIGFPGCYVERPDPSWGLPEDAYDADLGLAASFWTEASASFGRDPGVIFELWNEPVVDPKLWRSTGQHWPLLKATWSVLLDVVRKRSDALVLVSGGRWAHDLRGVAHDLLDDPRVAYTWHCYPGQGRADPDDTTSSLDGLNAVKPVVVTEWGFCPACARDLRGTPDEFGLPLTRDVLDRLGLHSTAWCWSPGASPAMLEADWKTPTVFGAFVRRYLRASKVAATVDARAPGREGVDGPTR